MCRMDINTGQVHHSNLSAAVLPQARVQCQERTIHTVVMATATTNTHCVARHTHKDETPP